MESGIVNGVPGINNDGNGLSNMIVLSTFCVIFPVYTLKLEVLFITLIVCPSSLAQGPGEPFHPMTAPGARGIRLTGHTLIWENPTSILYWIDSPE